MTWRGIPAVGDQRGPQHLMSAHDLVQGPLERRDVKPAHELDGRRDVIRRAARFQLIEEPEPLLRERGRQRNVAVDRHERRGRGSRPILQSLLDDACQPRDGRVFEEIAQGCLDSERLAEPRQELDGQERVAAALEEIVVSTDRFAAQQFGPDFGQGFFDRPSRRYEIGTRSSVCPSGVREGLAVDLAIGRQRECVQEHKRRGDHVLGNRSQEPVVAARPRCSDSGRSRSDDVRGQAHLAARIRTRRDDRLAHRRVPRQSGLDLAELDAKPADLDLVIDPPQAFKRAVGPPSGKVAGPVEPTAQESSRTGRG